MKRMTRIPFGKRKVIKLSGAHYINSFVEGSIFIIVDGEKYYKIKKGKLRIMGMKSFEVKKEKTDIDETIPLKTDYNWNIILPKLFFSAA